MFRNGPHPDGCWASADDSLGRMRTIVAWRCTMEPQVAAHAREMFALLSDPAIYEFENAPPVTEEWLLVKSRLVINPLLEQVRFLGLPVLERLDR